MIFNLRNSKVYMNKITWMVCGKSKEALKCFFCEAEEKGRQGMVSIRSLKATEWSENLNFCLELTLNLVVTYPPVLLLISRIKLIMGQMR